jgi:hypothetical protein
MAEFKVKSGRAIPTHLANIEGGLNWLLVKSEDAKDLKGILDTVFRSFFLEQPDGERHYGGENPELGTVCLTEYNETPPGELSITFTASEEMERKLDHVQRSVGSINLRNKTYSLDWAGASFCDSHEYEVPDAVARDLYDVLHKLGLECAGKV